MAPMHPSLPCSCKVPTANPVCVSSWEPPAPCKLLPTHFSLTRIWADLGSSLFWVLPRSPGWPCCPACPGRGMTKSSSTHGLCQPRPSHWFWETPREPAGLYWQEQYPIPVADNSLSRLLARLSWRGEAVQPLTALRRGKAGANS